MSGICKLTAYAPLKDNTGSKYLGLFEGTCFKISMTQSPNLPRRLYELGLENIFVREFNHTFDYEIDGKQYRITLPIELPVYYLNDEMYVPNLELKVSKETILNKNILMIHIRYQEELFSVYE